MSSAHGALGSLASVCLVSMGLPEQSEVWISFTSVEKFVKSVEKVNQSIN